MVAQVGQRDGRRFPPSSTTSSGAVALERDATDSERSQFGLGSSSDEARPDLILEELQITKHPPICHGRACLNPTEQVVSKSSPLFFSQSVEIWLGTVGCEDPPVHAVWRCGRRRCLRNSFLSENPGVFPSAILRCASATASTTASSPTSASHSSSSGVSPMRS